MHERKVTMIFTNGKDKSVKPSGGSRSESSEIWECGESILREVMKQLKKKTQSESCI